MSAVETGQMSAAETGQMSAVETRQMSTIETGGSPLAILYICLVSSSLTFASEVFDARWHEKRSCFLEALCCIILVLPYNFEHVCLQHSAT